MREITIQIDDDTLTALRYFYPVCQKYVTGRGAMQGVGNRQTDKYISSGELFGKYEDFVKQIIEKVKVKE